MILSCGEALIDMMPRKGADGADVYQPLIGGSVFNTAVAIGRLGVPSGLFCGISRDFFGDSLVQGLKDSGVSTKFLRLKDNHTTLALVKLVDGHARYAFIDDASAGRNLTKADLPKLPKSVTALHFGSFCLIDEPCGSTYETLARRHARKLVISYDPNIRPTLVKQRKPYLARINRMIALADIVKASDEDVKWMTGKDDFAKTARNWLKKGAKIVAITKGGAGVELFTKTMTAALPAPKVTVADTIGAGDTFTAGLLTYFHTKGLLEKKALAGLSEDDFRAAAHFAMKAAAITVSRPGANPPWARELAAGP